VRRFRRRRRRLAAFTLLPLAALTTTTTITLAASAPTDVARISSSARTVPFGGKVSLRGVFPGAADAPVEIAHRAKGTQSWQLEARTRTGASGRYAVRVKPRRSGYWRAELAAEPQLQSGGDPAAAAATASVDRGTGAEQIRVRSRTSATVAGRHAVAGRSVRIRGKVTPSGAERRVVVHVGGQEIATKAGRDGKFAATWRARSTGVYPVTVSARANRIATGSRDKAGRVTVYRPAAASWYGPGLYGNGTACGQTLTPSTLGVAHKTMPCGTKLRLRYGNRTVAVRVIDRGPFVAGREFDLTAATKQRLGFPDTGTVLSSK
jgi:rare lipoprotein A (peptidoglycan hydrolase)